ncbi:hypothetical protein RD792_011784 [Penstemon davidsonii]|uniref:Ubiquitin carboxyl-terminal hydrolase n=1 Tax=Penstemon davidsonii TaxID=160366 RepID=A0ABR0CWK8_9LAMI|nr:hypothetical protein RD792_011784 [Penstemon davidsonii]
MDSLFFSYDDNIDDDNDVVSFDHSFSDPGESLFLVSYRWWKEAVCGGSISGVDIDSGVLYSTNVQLNESRGEWDMDIGGFGGFGESEILLGMRREGGAGISGQEEDEEEEEDEDRVSCQGDFTLVSEWMFLTALKWHYDRTGVGNLLNEGDSAHDLFSLQIRLLYAWETNLLVIKISQKDNEIGAFNRAYSIFCTKSRMLQIWDFSGQTNHLFVNDRKLDSDQSNEILLQLQIYGLSCAVKDKEMRKDDMLVEQSRIDDPSSSASLLMNGCQDKVNLFSGVQPSFSVGGGYCGTFALGLTGLYNLGNTCFMNSAIQCLVHTPKLVNYFLGNFRKDLNFENPLGMNGKLAVAFGDLLRKLWAGGETPVAPRLFKSTISSFAPQFSGYNQHDSQEFLAFLLDGLHEDLNRVKSKPYIQAEDEESRPDEEVADEYWENHLSRNDSIIVDLCQGQYRSTLVCPVCRKLSVTFDPFMYLSLPLPSTTLRKMTLTVLSIYGTTLPHPVTITVPNNGSFKDLVEALGKACSLRDDETLIIAEVCIYHNSIFRILEDSDDLIELIRDDDRLVAYRLPKDVKESSLVVFEHQQEDKSYFRSFQKFGIPLVARMFDLSKESEIHKEFLKLINPFLLPCEEFLNDDDASQKTDHDNEQMEDIVLNGVPNTDDKSALNLDAPNDFEFHLCEPSSPKKPIKLVVTWPEKMIQDCDTSILNLLPEVCNPALAPKWAQESISLYKCVDAFLKEEPLGPEDMWYVLIHSLTVDTTRIIIVFMYCPNCKEHRQASKKLDLWRLPEILVIHLKRFSYSRFFKNKLETFVDFPIDNFDLSNYVIHKNNKVSHRYVLYAVSNHYGGMGGGHYTAFAKLGLDRWYEFDDSHVFPVTEDQIKTRAAYVLFYKRI